MINRHKFIYLTGRRPRDPTGGRFNEAQKLPPRSADEMSVQTLEDKVFVSSKDEAPQQQGRCRNRQAGSGASQSDA